MKIPTHNELAKLAAQMQAVFREHIRPLRDKVQKLVDEEQQWKHTPSPERAGNKDDLMQLVRLDRLWEIVSCLDATENDLKLAGELIMEVTKELLPTEDNGKWHCG